MAYWSGTDGRLWRAPGRYGTIAPAAMTQQFLPYSPERDIYRLLGVRPTAGDEELMDAWRRLARTFHPDRNASARSHEEMQVVNAIRQLLSDPAERARYDTERRRWLDAEAQAIARASAQGERAISTPANRSSAERVAVAVGAGVKAFLVELTPVRCAACAAALARADRRCWLCGAPVEETARR